MAAPFRLRLHNVAGPSAAPARPSSLCGQRTGRRGREREAIRQQALMYALFSRADAASASSPTFGSNARADGPRVASSRRKSGLDELGNAAQDCSLSLVRATPHARSSPSSPRQSSALSSSCSAPFKAIRSRLPPTKPVVLKSGATSIWRRMTVGAELKDEIRRNAVAPTIMPLNPR